MAARLIDELYGNKNAETTVSHVFNPIQKAQVNNFEIALDTLNSNFNKGIISDSIYEKACSELDGLLEKAFQHKYIKREGTKGHYKYWYSEPKGKREGEKNNEDKKEFDPYKYRFNVIEEHNAKIQNATEKNDSFIQDKKTLDNTISNENLRTVATNKIINQFKKLNGSEGDLNSIKENAKKQIAIIHKLNDQLYGKNQTVESKPEEEKKDDPEAKSKESKESKKDEGKESDENIKKEARKWWSSLSINEMKDHLSKTPFFSKMGMDYTLAHKHGIEEVYKEYKKSQSQPKQEDNKQNKPKS
jgi:hypothetical protein